MYNEEFTTITMIRWIDFEPLKQILNPFLHHMTTEALPHWVHSILLWSYNQRGTRNRPCLTGPFWHPLVYAGNPGNQGTCPAWPCAHRAGHL